MTQKRIRILMLLLTLAVLVVTAVSIYLYINHDRPQSDSAIDSQSDKVESPSGITTEEAQAAIKNGTYGILARDEGVYDLRHNKLYDPKTDTVYNIDSHRKKLGVSDNQSEWKSKLADFVKE